MQASSSPAHQLSGWKWVSLSPFQSMLLPGLDDGCLKATHLEPKACSCLATLPKIAAERNWQPRSQDDNDLHGLVSCASSGRGLDSMYCPTAVSPKCQIHWPFWHQPLPRLPAQLPIRSLLLYTSRSSGIIQISCKAASASLTFA